MPGSTAEKRIRRRRASAPPKGSPFSTRLAGRLAQDGSREAGRSPTVRPARLLPALRSASNRTLSRHMMRPWRFRRPPSPLGFRSASRNARSRRRAVPSRTLRVTRRRGRAAPSFGSGGASGRDGAPWKRGSPSWRGAPSAARLRARTGRAASAGTAGGCGTGCADSRRRCHAAGHVRQARTAESVVFTHCPPGPLARNACTSQSRAMP